MITDAQAVALVQAALHTEPRSLARQSLTHSGNAVFRVVLADRETVVLRVSPRPRTFAYTQHNLSALAALGLPVQSVMAAGPTDAGGSFIILNWIPGRDLIYELPQMNAAQTAAVAGNVVDYQKRVGTLPMSKAFGWAPIGRSAATATWSAVFGPAASETESTHDNPAPLERLRGRLRALRRSVEPYFATIRPVCFLDDLTTKNILVEDGVLRGIIDVDFVCYGDPLMSVGTTLASIAAEVGDAGRHYGDELVRCWAPSAAGRRAIRFYAALWLVGFVSAAQTAGDTDRAAELAAIAQQMLAGAEQE